MRTFKLVIAFNGARYEGWQSQRKNKTLQEVFEKILRQIFKTPLHLISSSRTDSGVHAEGLVASFRVKTRLKDGEIKKALNFHLPKDVLVRSVKTVRADFNARKDARSKTYRYDIWNSKTRPLFEAPYVWWVSHELDINRMKKAARFLKGKHDFSAFKDKGDVRLNLVRTIHRLSLTAKGPLIRLLISADGYLYHMVRIIAGTLIEIGRGRRDPKEIPAILASKDRKQAGPTAQAQGLTLLKVTY